MPNRQRTTVELPAWTVSRGQTYLNEKVHGEGREDLEPLRGKVAETTPSDGRLELDRGEYQTFQRVVRDGAERELQQLEGQEANILGDAEQQREAARKARQGVVNNPPEFGVTGRSADSPLFDAPVAPQATDIGRRSSGRFDRRHTEPEISTEPIAREQQTGRFQVDPFDITPGYEGAPPAGGDRREINDVWDVQEGDRFRRSKGMADEWQVKEIEEQQGFTEPVREVTFEAVDYGGPIADVEVRSGNSTKFEREFTPAWRED